MATEQENNLESTGFTLTGSVEYRNRAANLLKGSINAGEAIVNLLSSTGIAGFRFHIGETEQINMENDITDHYIDSNSAVQDHVAQKPITMNLRGFQGEYFYSVNKFQDMLAKVIPTLTLVKQFLPKLPVQVVKNKIAKQQNNLTQPRKTNKSKESEVNTFNAFDLWNLFQEIHKLKSRQTQAFFFFNALWQSKAIFSVETTWKKYDNMILSKVVPLRDKNRDITDFTISLKQLNFTQSLSEDYKTAAGRVAQQKGAVIKKGVDKGEKVSAV